MTLETDRLASLRRRYASYNSPLGCRTKWSDDFIEQELRLQHFREDNCYLWQRRYFQGEEEFKYYLYAEYLAKFDNFGYLTSLGEDESFGCQVYHYDKYPTVSRDLLDSINEIYFLDRMLALRGRERLRVLDIGAGYGRLAHRMVQAMPNIEAYCCVDAVAESTLLSEYYLKYRGVNDVAYTVPLDEIAGAVRPGAFDLAINIHSFSEMPYRSVEAWIELLASSRTPLLLVVPNHADRPVSWEQMIDDRRIQRRDLMQLFSKHDYRLLASEPVFNDADVRYLIGRNDHFMLFELCRDS